MKARFLSITSLVVILSMVTSTAFALPAPPGSQAGSTTTPQPANLFQAADASGPAIYIVQLEEPALASYEGDIAGLAPTSPRVTGTSKLDPTTPESKAYLKYLEGRHAATLSAMRRTLGRSPEVRFQYLAALNGFAVTLSPDEAAKVAALPGVKAVYRDVERQMDTDVGPIHIGAPAIWTGDTGTGVATRGEGIIIGMIDSGINSQHPSFAATDGDG